jgi:hypothetical protein
VSLSDSINWDNVPQAEEGVLNPHYPALLDQVFKCNKVARQEAISNQVSHTKIYAAFDELRFGVEQLIGDVR